MKHVKRESKMKIFIILFFSIFIYADSNTGRISPVVPYWKTLSSEEKETFLFSYLTQVYETHTDLQDKVGYGGITEWYYQNRAELVYGIFDKLDDNRVEQLISFTSKGSFSQVFITDTHKQRSKEILEKTGIDYEIFNIVN